MQDLLETIATREFTWYRANGTAQAAQAAYVDISRPNETTDPDPTQTDWLCTVTTRGLGPDASHVVLGVDAVQALYHALILAGQLVATSPVSLAATVDWAELPNFGFPAAPAAPTGMMTHFSQCRTQSFDAHPRLSAVTCPGLQSRCHHQYLMVA